jgi:hypothetical protein
MVTQKIIRFFSFTIVGFTITHSLLIFLITSNDLLYQQILFHYSDSLTWYVLFFLLPLLGALIFYLILKNKLLPKGLSIIFSSIAVIQISFTILASTANYMYWGYAFKRPPVFDQINQAYKIITCSSINNYGAAHIKTLHITSDTFQLYERSDIYYDNIDRPFLVFQDIQSQHGHLYDLPKIFLNPDKKISNVVLQNIEKQIEQSDIIDNRKEGYDKHSALYGVVTEFITISGTKYCMVSLGGQQVSNDHYPRYELLFIETNNAYKLIEKQRFYIDIAGLEGFEYATKAPFFSLLLTIIGVIVSLITWIVNRIIKASR